MVPFRDHHSCGHFMRRRVALRKFDVGELEKLERMELPQALAYRALSEQLAGPVDELPPNALVVNAGVTDHGNRPEGGLLPGSASSTTSTSPPIGWRVVETRARGYLGSSGAAPPLSPLATSCR